MKFHIICFIVVALASIKVVESLCGCRVPFKSVGCMKDKRNDRALPDLLINERDKSSDVYNGIDVDWYNWNQYLPEFTCRCAEAANEKGHRYFGLQYWGECWSGPSPATDDSFNKHGSGEKCYGAGYEKCSDQMNDCVGAANHNYVFEIVLYNCSIKYERLGCYKDENRPLKNCIITDRGYNHEASSGLSVGWYNYDTYLPDFACRCAEKAVEKGFDTFGVQFWGECWSGENATDDYHMAGSTDNCENQCYDPCRKNDRICTGKGYTNFVYRVTTDKCEMSYSSVGCFKENPDDRALNELIIDDLHPESSKFMGLVFDTLDGDWEKYLEGLICRCARKVKEKGFTTFGIYNGGECWSGANALENYNQYGGDDAECFVNDEDSCDNSLICTGGIYSNYVYKLEIEAT